MFKLISTLITTLLLGGCINAHEASYVDHEFGMAQRDAFDRQIAYKTPENAEKTPEGMPGIHSEKIMDTYQNSFDRDTGNDNNFTRGASSISAVDNLEGQKY